MDLWPPQSFWRKSHKQWLVIPTTPVGPQHRCILNSTRCKKIYKSIFQNIQTNFPKYTNQFSKIYKSISKNLQTNFPKYTNQFFQNIQINFQKSANQFSKIYKPIFPKLFLTPPTKMSYTTPHYYRKCEILWYDDYLANGPFNGQKKSDHFKWKGKHLQTKRLPQRIWRKFSFPPTSPHRPLDPSRDAVSRSKYRTELTNDHISEIYVCLSHCSALTQKPCLALRNNWLTLCNIFSCLSMLSIEREAIMQMRVFDPF